MPTTPRRLVPLALAGLSLALPAAADAKGLSAVSVCGAGDCREVRGHERLMALMSSGVMEGTPSLAASRPRPAPFYRVRVEMSAPERSHSWTSAFVPSSGLWRAEEQGGRWVELPPAGAAALRRVARGLRPFPAPRITAARVGGRPAGDPASYARLFATGEDVGRASPGPRDWVPIALRGDRPNPWTGARVRFSPSRNELARDGVVLRLPRTVAQEVERDAGLASGDGSRGATGTWLAIGAALSGLAALALLLHRRGERPGPRAPAAA